MNTVVPARRVALALLASSSLVLTACSGDGEDSAASSTSSAASTSSASSAESTSAATTSASSTSSSTSAAASGTSTSATSATSTASEPTSTSSKPRTTGARPSPTSTKKKPTVKPALVDACVKASTRSSGAIQTWNAAAASDSDSQRDAAAKQLRSAAKYLRTLTKKPADKTFTQYVWSTASALDGMAKQQEDDEDVSSITYNARSKGMRDYCSGKIKESL